MGEALEVAKVLVTPAMKLMDLVGGAIGTAYAPHHKRKMADATAYEIDTIGKAMRSAADMPVMYTKDGVVINSEDFQRLMQRASNRFILQETIKQHNIESVVDNAYEILETENKCSAEPVEQGWINRFFNSVSDVSDEDLQELWGKVLAGEIKQPKSYSLRTLEILKNLSKAEAESFKRLALLIVKIGDEEFVPSNVELLNKYGVSYSDILSLDECGLINSDGMVSLNPKVSIDMQVGIYNYSNILLLKGKNVGLNEISFGVFTLTNAGREIYSILNHFSNENFLCDFAEVIEKRNIGKIVMTLHKIIKIDENGISYDKSIIQEFPKTK